MPSIYMTCTLYLHNYVEILPMEIVRVQVLSSSTPSNMCNYFFFITHIVYYDKCCDVEISNQGNRRTL